MNITNTKHVVACSSKELDTAIEGAILSVPEEFKVAGIKYSCVLLSPTLFFEAEVQYSALIIFHR